MFDRIPFRQAVLAAIMAGSAAALCACIPIYNDRGDLPSRDRLAEIHPGQTTKGQVVKILGSPSSIGVFDNNAWYYISRKTKQVSFFEPDVLDQQVYVVNFDGKGVVRSIGHRTMADAKEIEPAPGATPAPGRELTFLEQVIGNVGRFNRGGGTSSSTGGGERERPHGASPNADPGKPAPNDD